MTEPKDKQGGTTSRERSPTGERATGVADPSWEEILSRGQDAAEEHGNLEADLAMLHLLRHAREPEPLADRALEEIWGAVDEAVTPVPWWKRKWIMWAAPVAAAAAVMVIVLQPAEDGTAVARQDVASEMAPSKQSGLDLDEDDANVARVDGKSRARVPAGAPAGNALAVNDEEAEPAEFEAGLEEGAAEAASPAFESERAAKGARSRGGALALEKQFAMLELDARAALHASVDRERQTLRHELIAHAKRGGR
jgi:hypothetical protein